MALSVLDSNIILVINFFNLSKYKKNYLNNIYEYYIKNNPTSYIKLKKCESFEESHTGDEISFISSLCWRVSWLTSITLPDEIQFYIFVLRIQNVTIVLTIVRLVKKN